DVENLAGGFRMAHQTGNAFDHVLHVAEAASLRAVAIDGNRLAGQRLANEPGDDHAILTGLAWTDGIEQPYDHNWQAGFVPVSQPEEFVESLGTGISPAAGGGGTDQAVAVFPEREL